ncbi:MULTISPECIES: SatD family protein [unclassified Aureispira]|uniref:SatD family protein n=1 Tax=unclassified Aureispira TaxID=2649989 RepID=UPI000698F201|nr:MULTISPECIES: SatD family protein [unclassified Aureispira]WMX14383.1 SatD family protein [Aureispira sp. CCB-E]
MKEQHYILMADIIGSGSQNGGDLMKDFKELVEKVNRENNNKLLSPLTITLGDEFQGVATSLEDAINLIIALEEEIIDLKKAFKLRYVLYHGVIDTPINSEVAYGMLGEGLTQARALLESLKKDRKRRFHVHLMTNEYLMSLLNLTFLNYQSIVDDWRMKDWDMVKSFLNLKDYKKVAEVLGKDNSSVFRRKDSLEILEYFSCRGVLRLLSSNASNIQASFVPERDEILEEVAELL